MDFSGGRTFCALPENHAIRFHMEIEWATVLHLRKNREYRYQSHCQHLPSPSTPPTLTYCPAISLDLANLTERGRLTRGDHGFLHVASTSALHGYTSVQEFRLVVDNRFEYGMYRAFLMAEHGMTGLEFMYLSEPVKRDIVADMSGYAEGTHEFERVKNDILYSRITVPCIFFQCLESPVLNIATMGSHWQAEPTGAETAVADIAVADNDPDVSPIFLPEPAVVENLAENAARIEAPEAGEPLLAVGEETLPSSPIVADSQPDNSTASVSAQKIEIADSDFSIPDERNDDIPQPSSSQSHGSYKIRRASSTVFRSTDRKKRKSRINGTHREVRSLEDAY